MFLLALMTRHFTSDILPKTASYSQLSSEFCKPFTVLLVPAAADSMIHVLLRCASPLSYTIPMVGMLKDGCLLRVVRLVDAISPCGFLAAGL